MLWKTLNKGYWWFFSDEQMKCFCKKEFLNNYWIVLINLSHCHTNADAALQKAIFWLNISIRPCGSGTSFMQTLWTKTHFACRRSALSWLARNKILSAQSLFLFSLLSFAVLFTNLSHNCHFLSNFWCLPKVPRSNHKSGLFFLLFCRWWVTFFNNCHSFNSIDQHSF